MVCFGQRSALGGDRDAADEGFGEAEVMATEFCDGS